LGKGQLIVGWSVIASSINEVYFRLLVLGMGHGRKITSISPVVRKHLFPSLPQPTGAPRELSESDFNTVVRKTQAIQQPKGRKGGEITYL
jgi:hypothetical protein